MASRKYVFGTILPFRSKRIIKWIIDGFQSWDQFLKTNTLKSPKINWFNIEGYLFLNIPETGTEGVELVFQIRNIISKTHVRFKIKTCARGVVEEHSGYIDARGIFRAKFQMTAFQMFSKIWLDQKDKGSIIILCDLEHPGVPNIQEKGPNIQDQRSSENSDILLSDSSDEEILLPQRKRRRSTGGAGSSRNPRLDSDSEWEEEETLLQKESVKKLKSDLKVFGANSDCFDVTIKVRRREFRAHRAILCARCAVFRSMFAHGTIEKAGKVVIDDCDPDAFQDFLDHIYTGNVMQVCAENAFGLFVISDKYGMLDLRDACVDYLGEQLSVDLFCETVILAEQHSEEELFNLALLFFYQNADEIMESAKWQTFLAGHATAGNKLFREALKMAKRSNLRV